MDSMHYSLYSTPRFWHHHHRFALKIKLLYFFSGQKDHALENVDRLLEMTLSTVFPLQDLSGEKVSTQEWLCPWSNLLGAL